MEWMKTIKNDLEAATSLAEQRLDAARSLLNNEEAAKEASDRLVLINVRALLAA